MIASIVDLDQWRSSRWTRCAAGASDYICRQDLLRRMVQALWNWLVFVDRATADIVMLESGFSEDEIRRFGGRAFELLLKRQQIMRRSF